MWLIIQHDLHVPVETCGFVGAVSATEIII